MDIDAEYARLRALGLRCPACNETLSPGRCWSHKHGAFLGLICDNGCGRMYAVNAPVEPEEVA